MNNTNEAVLRDAYLALMNLEYVNTNAEDNCGLYGHGFLAAKMKALAIIHPALAATATVAKDGGVIGYISQDALRELQDPEAPDNILSLWHSKTTHKRAEIPVYLATPKPEASAEQPAGGWHQHRYITYPNGSKGCEFCSAAPISEDTGNHGCPKNSPYGPVDCFDCVGATTAPDTSARDAALEEAAQIVSEEICSCCWNEEAQAFAEHAADTIRALKTVPGEPT